MPFWLQPIISFLGQRMSHFFVYLIIGLMVIGIPYKLFVKDTNKINVSNGGVYKACEPETPIVGCSISRIHLKAIWKSK